MSGKLTIQFTNGKEKSFEFDPQVQFGEGATSRLKEMIATNAIIVQMEDEFEIIPFANVQNILVKPAKPEFLKKIKIPGAVIVTNRCLT